MSGFGQGLYGVRRPITGNATTDATTHVVMANVGSSRFGHALFVCLSKRYKLA